MNARGPSRRAVLKVGALGGLALAAGGVGLALMPTRIRPVPEGLVVLDEVTASVLAAVADRVCPQTDPWPTPTELRVVGRIDAFLATLHPGDAGDVVLALKALETGLIGALLDGRFRTFSAASPAAQDWTLAAWRDSSLSFRQQVYRALRGLCASTYFSHPDVFALVGYGGAPDFGQHRAPAIQPQQAWRVPSAEEAE